jgi:hypothetical protein
MELNESRTPRLAVVCCQVSVRQVLTDGLRPFQPRLMYVVEVGADESIEAPRSAEELAAEELGEAPLYAICRLELFNHLAEHALVRVCAN